MADIRIKDLGTTASVTASDDFMAVDGTTNGTRKLSAATPSFATSVTVPGVSAPASTDLTLAGGSSGASLVLGAGGATTAATINVPATATGRVLIYNASGTTSRTDLDFSNAAFSAANATTRIRNNITNSGSNGALSFWTSASGTIAQNATLTDTGNLLIGTTTDATSLAGGLVVNGSGAGATSSSTSTGALRVTGGVGVSGAIYADELRVKKGGGTSSYISGLTLESGAGGGNFWPGVEWRDATLGSMARQYAFRESGSFGTSMVFQTSINGSATPTTALRLDSYQAAFFAGAVSLSTAGTTISIKSGTNAAAGTVTLSGGAATITSTAIDVNTVIVMSIKTKSGSFDHAPSVLVAAGSATIDGHNSDDSTYNWVALKVN
jgi:hypothetical protein